MSHFCQKHIVLFVCLIVVFFHHKTQADQAALFYRWIDKTGKIHYSDKVTPDHAAYGREVINDKGITVKTIERAKTHEEIVRLRELKKLRLQQQKLIEQQQARDRLLLFTFEDVTNSLGDKLAIIDSKIKIIRASIEQLEKKLSQQKKIAAQWEKSGRMVPQVVIFKIKEIESQISSYQSAIEQHSTKRIQLQKKYASDTQRYKKLVKHQYEKINTQKSTGSSWDQEELSVIKCSAEQDCKRLWQLTREYLLIIQMEKN